MLKINKILIPNKPHLDPIATIYLLYNYGEALYPGIENSEIIFWKNSDQPTKEEVEKFESEGGLMIDVGGGEFDHHNNTNGIEETPTEIVARKLGIEQKPELSELLSYIREDDLEGLHNRYGDLAFLLKNMYKQDYPQIEVVKKALELIHIFQEGQKQFHVYAREEFEQKAKILAVKGKKRKWKVCVVETDNLQVGNYAITQKKVSIVIQKRSSGHVMILTNKNHRVDLKNIVAKIRKRDLELRNYSKPIILEKLKFYGNNQLIPYWFYHKALNSFLNGSDALNKTEATKVPFEEIVDIVVEELEDEKKKVVDKNQEKKSFLKLPSGVEFDEKSFSLLINIKNRPVIPENIKQFVKENNFQEKQEYHITIIGFNKGRELKAKFLKLNEEEKNNFYQNLEKLINNINWEIKFLPEFYHVSKDYQFKNRKEHRESIIQLIDLPAIVEFYQKLLKIIDIKLEEQLPHITLFVKGNSMGIGINSKDEFEKLNPDVIST